MFSEQDRVQIRRFLGFGAIFLQAEPRLENAITTVQSVAEFGNRPDSSTEQFIKGLIYGTAAVVGPLVTPGPTAQNIAFAMPATQGLLQIMQKVEANWSLNFVYKADKEDAVIDAFRGLIMLQREGRRLAGSLARMLGMRGVRADVFTAAEVVLDDDPFFTHESC